DPSAHLVFFFFEAEDGIRGRNVTGVQTCALPISSPRRLCRRDSCAVGTPSPGPLRPRNAVNRQILEPFRSPWPQCPPDAIPAASGRLLQAGRNDKDPRRSER